MSARRLLWIAIGVLLISACTDQPTRPASTATSASPEAPRAVATATGSSTSRSAPPSTPAPIVSVAVSPPAAGAEIRTSGRTTAVPVGNLGVSVLAIRVTNAAIEANRSNAPGAVVNFHPIDRAVSMPAEGGGTAWFDLDGRPIAAPPSAAPPVYAGGVTVITERARTSEGVSTTVTWPDGHTRLFDAGMQVSADGRFGAYYLQTTSEVSPVVTHLVDFVSRIDVPVGGRVERCIPYCEFGLPAPQWAGRFLVFHNRWLSIPGNPGIDSQRTDTYAYDTTSGDLRKYDGYLSSSRTGGPVTQLRAWNERNQPRLRLIDLETRQEQIIPIPDAEYASGNTVVVVGGWMVAGTGRYGYDQTLLTYPGGQQVARYTSASQGRVSLTLTEVNGSPAYAVRGASGCGTTLVVHPQFTGPTCLDHDTGIEEYVATIWASGGNALAIAPWEKAADILDIKTKRVFSLPEPNFSAEFTGAGRPQAGWSPDGAFYAQPVTDRAIGVFEVATGRWEVVTFDRPLGSRLGGSPWVDNTHLAYPMLP